MSVKNIDRQAARDIARTVARRKMDTPDNRRAINRTIRWVLIAIALSVAIMLMGACGINGGDQTGAGQPWTATAMATHVEPFTNATGTYYRETVHITITNPTHVSMVATYCMAEDSCATDAMGPGVTDEYTVITEITPVTNPTVKITKLRF